MKSFGKIYLDSDCIDLEKQKAIEKMMGISFDSEDQRLAKKMEWGLAVFRFVYHREPDDLEKKNILATCRRSCEEDKKEHLKITKRKNLTELTHRSLSLENIFEIAVKVSQIVFGKIAFIAGFDEGALQLCILDNGKTITLHQIGEELSDFSLAAARGDAESIASFFKIPINDAETFINLDNVMDAEDCFFGFIK